MPRLATRRLQHGHGLPSAAPFASRRRFPPGCAPVRARARSGRRCARSWCRWRRRRAKPRRRVKALGRIGVWAMSVQAWSGFPPGRSAEPISCGPRASSRSGGRNAAADDERARCNRRAAGVTLRPNPGNTMRDCVFDRYRHPSPPLHDPTLRVFGFCDLSPADAHASSSSPTSPCQPQRRLRPAFFVPTPTSSTCRAGSPAPPPRVSIS